jgi:hypothetical protein
MKTGKSRVGDDSALSIGPESGVVGKVYASEPVLERLIRLNQRDVTGDIDRYLRFDH